MPRRISRFGGTTLRRSFMTNAYSPGMLGASSLRGDQAPVLGHHAAILDDADARLRELLGGGVVTDAELEPHHLRAPRESQDLVGMAAQIFGAAEYLDDVGFLGQGVEPCHGHRVVQTLPGEARIHRP